MLDFNDAPEQSTGSFVPPIPPDSIVKVRIELQQPDTKKLSPKHSAFSVSDRGNHYLSIKSEVISGQFAGKNIYDNYTVDMDRPNEKTQKAVNSSRGNLRAMLEAARNINPKDPGTQAAQGRMINDWFDLDGLEFPIMVEIEQPKPGDKYINNRTKKIITPDMPEYQIVMAGGEIITDKAIPPIPQGQQQRPATNYQSPPGSAYQQPPQGGYQPPPTPPQPGAGQKQGWFNPK